MATKPPTSSRSFASRICQRTEPQPGNGRKWTISMTKWRLDDPKKSQSNHTIHFCEIGWMVLLEPKALGKRMGKEQRTQGLVSMSRYVSHHPTLGDIISNRYLFWWCETNPPKKGHLPTPEACQGLTGQPFSVPTLEPATDAVHLFDQVIPGPKPQDSGPKPLDKMEINMEVSIWAVPLFLMHIFVGFSMIYRIQRFLGYPHGHGFTTTGSVEHWPNKSL